MMIFGTIGVFVDRIALPSDEIALYRALIATVLLAGYLLVTRQGFRIGNPRELPLLLLSGVAMGFNWILLFEAYRYTTVSVATLSYYFAPVLMTVMSGVLFRERLTLRQGVCFVLSTGGLALVVLGTPQSLNGNEHLIGIAFGLGAAALYATVVLLNKGIKGVEGIGRTFWQFVAAAAVLLPYVWCTGGFTVHTLQADGWVSLLILGVVHTGITYCLYFGAVKALSGQQIAIFSYIDPLFAVALSATVLSEPLSVWQMIGGAMILIFTLLSEWKRKTSRK